MWVWLNFIYKKCSQTLLPGLNLSSLCVSIRLFKESDIYSINKETTHMFNKYEVKLVHSLRFVTGDIACLV